MLRSRRKMDGLKRKIRSPRDFLGVNRIRDSALQRTHTHRINTITIAHSLDTIFVLSEIDGEGNVRTYYVGPTLF
jgi:hypothetical protein